MIKNILMFIDAMYIGMCLLAFMLTNTTVSPFGIVLLIGGVGAAVACFATDINRKIKAKRTPKRTLR